MRRWHLALVMATPALPQNRMIYAPQVYETEAYGFAQAVTNDGLILLSGQVGWTRERQLPTPGDFAAQARQALANIRHILLTEKRSPNAIMRLRWYVVALEREKMRQINALQADFFSGGYKPASTVVGVAALGRSELLVEIEAEAR
ncbi:MAG: RidA family protein [Spirochaetes bacterium]|nr:RidA family protein [Spirochaetota bacterium]